VEDLIREFRQDHEIANDQKGANEMKKALKAVGTDGTEAEVELMETLGTG